MNWICKKIEDHACKLPKNKYCFKCATNGGSLVINFANLIKQEIKNGYDSTTAPAKVCQDLVLLAISKSKLSQNVTIKGGVLLKDKTKNIRRATFDIDIDFVKYPLSIESIESFVNAIDCISDFKIKKIGSVEEVRKPGYCFKRVPLSLTDKFGNKLSCMVDVGEDTHPGIIQEKHCFCIDCEPYEVTLLSNSNEQVFCEKLRSLLKLGQFSTRYIDVFDMAFLSSELNPKKLDSYIKTFVFNDDAIREKDYQAMLKRIKMAFNDKNYRNRLAFSNRNWTSMDLKVVLTSITKILENVSSISK